MERLRTTDVSIRELDGETVLLDLRSSQYIKINQSGTIIVRCLDGSHTREQIVDSITAEFDIDASTAGADLDVFLDTLRNADLLESA